MRMLVTGGLGFIGSALIRKILNETDHTILNLDSCTYAAMPEALEEKDESAKYNFLKVDLRNFQEVSDAIANFKPHKIFHLAAESHVDRSIEDPGEFINTNIIGTFNILESIRIAGNSLPENFTLLHISTDEVFGTLDFNDKPFNETSPYQPNSPYSASKASSDMLVRAWHETYDIKTVITNCSNNYGPWQNPEKLIPKIIFNAINGNMIPIYGNGKNIRDWLHVEDHVSALLAASETDQRFNRYVIGANQEISNIDLTKMICNYLDKKIPKSTTYIKQVQYVTDRLGHDLRYAIDASHISNTIGFNPAYKLEHGIQVTIDWYLENQDWVKTKVALAT